MRCVSPAMGLTGGAAASILKKRKGSNWVPETRTASTAWRNAWCCHQTRDRPIGPVHCLMSETFMAIVLPEGLFFVSSGLKERNMNSSGRLILPCGALQSRRCAGNVVSAGISAVAAHRPGKRGCGRGV